MQSPGQKPWDMGPFEEILTRRLPHILPRRCSIQGSLWPETNAWRFLQAPTWRYIDLDMGWYGMIWVWVKVFTNKNYDLTSGHTSEHPFRLTHPYHPVSYCSYDNVNFGKPTATNWLLLSPLCRQWASQDAENLCKQCVSLQSSLFLWIKTHGIPWFKVVVDIHPPNIL